MSEIEFTKEEFAFLARELREHGDYAPVYKALLSNNYNVILAALDSAAEQLGKWRPIETAPKDGTHFLALQVVIADERDEDDRIIARNTRTEQVVVAYEIWGSIVQFPWNGGMPINVSYSHWQPLPRPPQNNALQTAETQAQSTTSPPLINQV